MIKPEEYGTRYYNKCSRADKPFYIHTEEHRKNASVRMKEHMNKPNVKIKHQAKMVEVMNRPDIREKYLDGLSKRDNKSSDPIVIEKRRQSMIKTMAEKFPIEDRKQRMEFGSEEYREFMRQHAKQMWADPNHKNNISEKISAGLKGKQNRLGQKNTPEHNEKIRQSNLGQKRSPEACEKIRQSNLGRKHSEEHRRAQSDAQKIQWAKRRQKNTLPNSSGEGINLSPEPQLILGIIFIACFVCLFPSQMVADAISTRDWFFVWWI
jgi:hypothetical protein